MEIVSQPENEKLRSYFHKNKQFLTIGISANVLNDKSNVERASGLSNVIRIKFGNVSKEPFNILWFKLIPYEWYRSPSLITFGAPGATRGCAETTSRNIKFNMNIY
jgi:hypothetical protein